MGLSKTGFSPTPEPMTASAYEIWPVDEPNDITEEWALSLVDDDDDSEELGRFDNIDKAQLAAELRDIEDT